MVGALAGYAVFGGIVPALAIGGFAGSFPVASYRMRRAARRSAAMDAWPRMLEELRILTSSVGRSVPQALFEVGRRAPDVMRGAFDEAHREWLLRSEEHTSELQSLMRISYAVFCLKKKTKENSLKPNQSKY